MRVIDTENLCATGSFLEIGDVVLGKLLPQVEADHVKFGYIVHVPLYTFPDRSSSKSRHARFALRRP